MLENVFIKILNGSSPIKLVTGLRILFKSRACLRDLKKEY